jgi:hypothetical protein
VTAILAEPDWRARRAAHERRVDGWLTGHRERRRSGGKHPVEDFLFTYYSYRPAQLRRWHPGAGVTLAGAAPEEFGPDYHATPEGAAVDMAAVLARRAGTVAWIRALLRGTASRPPHLGCFGMHEWAMVYGLAPGELRHAGYPLRLGPEDPGTLLAL